ncbi:ABI family [Quillaja saponaria]|uniref:ABI family n=1 Tax=Quillaja saponaria TaxID=32244 RepID=A0AAD7VFE6_QUISA|nr:ABI family [Quillaja saponaria]KAJ7973852.1 ABI family [Quillaja saponaria]
MPYFSENNAFPESKFRINCLKQRLHSCEQYAHKLALRKVRWSENLPRFHSCYLIESSALTVERSKDKESRDSENMIPSKIIDKYVMKAEDDVPLFFYAYTPTQSSVKNLIGGTTTVEGDINSASVLPKGSNPTFHCQKPQIAGRGRKSLHSNDILSLIRHTK